MLDRQDEFDGERLAEHIARLPCNIELPATWTDFFNESGLVRAELPEKRRHLRWKNRTMAGLYCRETFPALPRSEQWHPIYVKDVSRSGAALSTPNSCFRSRGCTSSSWTTCPAPAAGRAIRDIEVAHCRYVQPKCYEVGVRSSTM